MRRVSAVLFSVLCLAAGASTVSAQQGIYMYTDAFRGDQVIPHLSEFKLNSVSFAATNAVSSYSTTGLTTGKVTFAPVKVSMRLHPQTIASLNKQLAMGAVVPSIEIRHYNSTNKLFYKTVFENVYLTSIATEGSDEAVETLEFAYVRVRRFSTPDAAGLSPLAQTGCWDMALNRAC